LPIYDFRCSECDDVAESFAGIDEMTQPCEKCGAKSRRLITTRYYLNNAMDITTDAITGDPVNITSKSQMDDLCRANDCAPSFGKGWY